MLVADDDGAGRHRLEETARHDARTDVRLRGEHQARAGIGDLADDRAAVEGQRAMVALVAVPELDAADLRRPVDIQHALLIEFTQDGVVPRRFVGQLLPVDAAIKDAVFVVQAGGIIGSASVWFSSGMSAATKSPREARTSFLISGEPV